MSRWGSERSGFRRVKALARTVDRRTRERSASAVSFCDARGKQMDEKVYGLFSPIATWPVVALLFVAFMICITGFQIEMQFPGLENRWTVSPPRLLGGMLKDKGEGRKDDPYSGCHGLYSPRGTPNYV